MSTASTPVKPDAWEDPDVETSGRREEILDAATRLFAEHGYSDAVTQALAETLSVGKGTIYRCFQSKRELFLAATDRGMRRLRASVAERVKSVEDPIEKVAVGIQAFFEFFDANPEAFELLIQERALFKDGEKPTYIKHREIVRERWVNIYSELIEQGRLRKEVDPKRTSVIIGDVLYGAMISNYFSGKRRPPEDQTREILDIVFLGILSDSERQRWSSKLTKMGEKSGSHSN
jgi:AcrR family transcriptional regulator